ncbi:F0F1 ATP synthase subunit alpha [candidate division WWE3 bacterium]|nr:F0F1 ATP synthase subunit alpha [candidate division WWE3 bacterium]
MDINGIINEIESSLKTDSNVSRIRNVGNVLSVRDGIATLDGLSTAKMSERIYCRKKNIHAMVLNLTNHEVGAIVLGNYTLLTEGDEFESTGEIMSIGVSDQIVGRVVNALGQPIDGLSSEIHVEKMMPVEKIAPGVIQRQPVNVPLQTGIMAIDAMVPIGRGQRELIIGDRNTGKTAIAIDTILNQKNAENPVICIYVAIGQKESRIAQLTQLLKDYGALEYSIIVDAPASDSVAMQYIAPYSGTSIAEYFLEKGRDVLIIYDDLTKHAWAYRQISLILRRPAGREAFPGDIFYLHSRLLERSCRLNEDLGGGSITALPVIETQFGDVSAYIPTNVISITDGQIFLESDLFNSGMRPAIDVGNSVSRVGTSAQTKSMKKVASKMRLDLAQFRELEAFAQFGSSDLDARTKSRIDRGLRIREILKQPQYSPISVDAQVGLLYAVNNGHLDTLPVSAIAEFKTQFVAYLETVKEPDLEEAIVDFLKSFNYEKESV